MITTIDNSAAKRLFDVNASLGLMNLFDMTPKDQMKMWFRRNFMLGGKEPTYATSREIRGNTPTEESERHRECLYQYRVWSGQDRRGGVLKAPKGLESTLDERYHEK